MTREPSRLWQQFLDFHRDNPEVYELFQRFTLEAARASSKVGAKMVWERMRWYASFETTGSSYKLNNNYCSYYARMFMRDHPEQGKLFEIRKVRKS